MQQQDLGESVILRGLRALVGLFRRDPSRSKKYALGSEVVALPASWGRWHGASPNVRGNPDNSILAVPGLADQPPLVRAALLDVAEELQIPVDSIAIAIAHESGWRADRANPLGAYGLIQLTAGARLPGFAGGALAAVACMTAAQQVAEVVRPYYARFGAKAKGADPGVVAMLNFLPAHAGKSASTVLAKRGEDIYQANPGFDRNGKGYFTVGDVYDSFASTANKAGGKRVAVDGRLVDGVDGARTSATTTTTSTTGATSATSMSGPAPLQWTQIKPPVKPQRSAPAHSAPKLAPTTTRDEPDEPDEPDVPAAPQFTSGTGWGEPTPELLTAAPSQFTLGTGAGPVPDELLTAEPMQLSMGGGGGRGMDQRRAGDDEPDDARFGAELRAQGAGDDDLDDEPFDGDEPDDARFGAELRAQGASDDIRGILLSAVRAGEHRPEAYMELPVQIGRHDLVVTILRDALQARVDGRWLRLGVTYAEQIEICRTLGLISPTQEIVDAAWEWAKGEGHLIDPMGLVQTVDDTNRMATVGFAAKHNDNIERALAKAGARPDEFWRPYGKSWVIDVSMAVPDRHGVIRHVAEYGWRQRSGRPIQGMGPGGHDPEHSDYSMTTAELVQRRARLATGEPVDLIEVYRDVFTDMDGYIEVYR